MIKITVKGFDELRSGLNRASTSMESLLSDAIRKAGEVTKENVARNAPKFDGVLKKSITNKTSKLRAEVFVGSRASAYGYVQEYGRRPGKMPPADALKRWAAAKLGSSDLAFVLARSIGKKGTKPQPFFQPGFDESLPEIEKFFNDVGVKIIGMI